MEKKQEKIEQLMQLILQLDNIEDCRALFTDLCTIRELRDLTQRFQVAEMLADGKSYQDISQATGASTATICRVNKCLLYGTGGYRRAVGGGEEKNG